MTRFSTILLFLLLFILPSRAQSSFSNVSEKPADTFSGDDYRAGESDSYYPEILIINDDDDLLRLQEQGVIILRRRGDMALTYIPTEEYENVTRRKGARLSVSVTPRKRLRNVPAMDVASQWYDAAKMHQGAGLPTPYTGAGVVVGLCDIGFDPSHPVFTASDGSTRVKRVVQYLEDQGKRIVMDDYSKMLEWETDDIDESHGTHVAGIMCARDLGNGLHGMAPDAELVATTSQLSDVGLLAGVEDVIEYARSVGKRAVINLSMGNYVGPHDGSGLFTRYLDILGEEAIICLSAGNEGSHNNTLQYLFSGPEDSFTLRLASRDWVQFNMFGMVDVWSHDDRPLRYRLNVYDETTSKIVISLPWIDFSENDHWRVSGDEGDIDYDEEFAKYYTGWVDVAGKTDSANNRFEVAMLFDAHTTDVSDKGPWAKYNLAFSISGEEGACADTYADGQYSFFKNLPGGAVPNSRMSFSELACGFNTISVGMYNTRNQFTSSDGNATNWGVNVGEVNTSSGYGTLIDGRVMPLTVAPGAFIISSYSTPHALSGDNIKNAITWMDVNGKKAYWNANAGTSMSCPYVAGCIATWLEAKPDLTLSQIRDVIETTNRSDHPNPTDPRHGRGWFDPYQSLVRLVNQTSTSTTDCSFHPSMKYQASTVTTSVPGDCNATLTIIDSNGRLIDSIAIFGGLTSTDLSHLGKGIYLATLRGEGITPLTIKVMR